MSVESTALSRNVGGHIDASLSLRPLMEGERLVRLETNAATLLAETSLTQLSNLVKRLLFTDWRVGTAILRLNPGQRELEALRCAMSWR